MHHESENFDRGKVAETEQLSKNGLSKNYNPVKEIDPRTGKEGTTIPDAFKNDGKSTTEVKNVKEQSLTRQLRLQERFSNNNGFKPELIINDLAQLTKPLIYSSFEIKTYDFKELTPADKQVSRDKNLKP